MGENLAFKGKMFQFGLDSFLWSVSLSCLRRSSLTKVLSGTSAQMKKCTIEKVTNHKSAKSQNYKSGIPKLKIGKF